MDINIQDERSLAQITKEAVIMDLAKNALILRPDEVLKEEAVKEVFDCSEHKSWTIKALEEYLFENREQYIELKNDKKGGNNEEKQNNNRNL